MTPHEKQIHSGNKVQNNTWTFAYAYLDIYVNMVIVQLTHLRVSPLIRCEALCYIPVLNITIVAVITIWQMI